MCPNDTKLKDEQRILKVVNAGPQPCCGNSAFESDAADQVAVHEFVQDYYAQRALTSYSCCGEAAEPTFYEADLLHSLPQDVAEFSLGCGDPITLAQLQPGEVVLDLGSGGGLDCFLASKQVGDDGFVIGIDMTPEMLARARSAAEKMGIRNVEFRQGYLEDMPVESNSVDVIISNCVINLSPDKPRVFAEMLRTLKPGGRVSVSDIVTSGELPLEVRKNMEAWGACVAGSLEMDDYVAALQGVGFEQVTLTAKSGDGTLLDELPKSNVFSASITALKPRS